MLVCELIARKMRNIAITLLSLVLTTLVIGNAFYQKKQFYPSVVYITKSNPSMAIIYIQAFIVVIIIGKLMRRIFFGELRAVEVEHLMERSWYAITETCLAFTVFRDDFNPKFLALFTLLLFLKAFHWLADERVDYMERSPVISWLFHVRIVSLLIILGILDVLFVGHAYQSTLTKGASVQLVFGFEYAILLTIVLNIVIKYAFHVNDFHELPWENKAVFLLYTELIMGFIKVILYFSFVIIMVRIYTLPLFAFRPMYYTVRAFKKAVVDVVMSRRAIRNMNTLYPDATPEELLSIDNVCIICREEMRSGAKKLPCNHIFHTSCLRSWFQRQQTCPTCRLNILRTPASPAVGQGAAVIDGGNGNNGGGAAGGVDNGGAGGPAAAGAGAATAGGNVPAAGNNDNTATGTSARNDTNTNIAGTSGAASSNTGARTAETSFYRDRTPLTPIAILRAASASGQQQRSSAAASSSSANNQFRDTTSQTNLSWTTNTPEQGPAFIPFNREGEMSFGSLPSWPIIPPYPHLMYNIPPPVPPRQGLSMEELKRLEKDTREGLEQRIQCLYTIQNMLDTAVLMMQQYTAAVAVNTASSYANPQQEQASTSNQEEIFNLDESRKQPNENVPSTAQQSSNFNLFEASSSGSARSQPFIDENTVSSMNTFQESNENNQQIKLNAEIVAEGELARSLPPLASTDNGPAADNSSTTDQEILRKRRLERFSNLH
ncbi:hypothetical protein O3M35_012902 [Rhynocoris fuscipes]|uniref:RING-type E3 ubiquitin transferase n=1 Tax=Rhynocoris fuscipes TaxID=488301 RepID=A0AAW1CKV4_9HEMI